MDIKIIYSPYNFFAWAKQNNIIPEQSFLVCAKPSQQDPVVSNGCTYYFVINEDLNESQQMTQAFVTVGACWANEKGKVPEEAVQQLIGQYTTNWLLQELTLLSSPKQHLDQTVINLKNDLIHPVAIGLSTIFKLGFLGADVLCYLGSMNAPTSDFYCNGANTSEQIVSFLSYIKKTFGDNHCSQIVEELTKDWKTQMAFYADKYGFVLVDYNFQELINTKV